MRHFVKCNSKTSAIPPLCSQSPDGSVIVHSTDEAKAACFNDYFASFRPSTMNMYVCLPLS